MRLGLDALYQQHDPDTAAGYFRKLLEQNPSHYGAHYQLAAALDAAGKREEARGWWEQMLSMAEATGDNVTADTARGRLKQQP
jgi:Tfp pilus assembly protein PilF